MTDNRTADAKYSRDVICTVLAKAWNAEQDSEKKTVRQLKTKLTVFERVGGLDTEKEPETPPEPPKESGGWSVGDTAWVIPEDSEMEPWFGKITEFSEDGQEVYLEDVEGEVDKKTGEKPVYDTPLSTLTEDTPGEYEEEMTEGVSPEEMTGEENEEDEEG